MRQGLPSQRCRLGQSGRHPRHGNRCGWAALLSGRVDNFCPVPLLFCGDLFQGLLKFLATILQNGIQRSFHQPTGLTGVGVDAGVHRGGDIALGENPGAVFAGEPKRTGARNDKGD